MTVDSLSGTSGTTRDVVEVRADGSIDWNTDWSAIGAIVLAFADWFRPDAWAAVEASLHAQLPADVRGSSPGTLRTLTYEPVYRPEGQVMRFDLLLPATDGGQLRRVAVPRESVEQWIADDRRILLDATAAGP